jgi:hypothetical protein
MGPQPLIWVIIMPDQLAFIGRTFKATRDHKTGVDWCQLDKVTPVLIDYTRKQHTFIIAKSGGGKSYLAGVVAEELARVMQNYCTLLIDPMGIFSTLKMPNTNKAEIEAWNSQCEGEVIPRAVEGCTIWVPASDVQQFLPGTFDRAFSLKAREFSQGTLCYAFDLEVLEPQAILYRKCQARLLRARDDYTLGELIAAIHEHGHAMGFQPQTVESLCTKLGALEDLGIVRDDAPEVHDVIKERAVAVLDLSQSSTYTSRIVVNFLAEKLLALRRQITRMVLRAKTTEMLVDKPAWYIPPVQIVLDEAHNYLQRNPVLRKVIKEGRNCALMMTAISQSPDLTRDVYANITHVFVGPLVYEDDIIAVRAMLPIEILPKDFKQKIHNLSTGTFLYYNVDEKTEKLIKVRPRRTLHPASTDLKDERQYFKKNGAPEPEPSEDPEQEALIAYYIELESKQNQK